MYGDKSALRIIELAARKAGMAGVGVHTVRHGAAAAWLEADVPFEDVADLLGLSSAATTGDIYGHTFNAGRAAVDHLSGALRL